jgi:hypothetical protein
MMVMLKKPTVILLMIFALQACGTLQALNVLNDATCKTEIGKKDSKFTCEFEGKKLVSKSDK